MANRYGSDDLTVKVWGTENTEIQSGGGFAPWLVFH